MPGQRSPDVIQVNLRLNKDLHKRLKAAAQKSGNSLNAEMAARLEQTFQRDSADEILNKARRHEAEAKRLEELTISTVAKLQAELEAAKKWPTIIEVEVPSGPQPKRKRK